MEPNRTIWRWLADWIAVRRPNRLVVDGVFLMFWSGLVYLAWSIWWQSRGDTPRANMSMFDRVLSLLLATSYSGLFNLGVVLVAVGCARIIADGMRGRDSAGTGGAGETGGAGN